MNNTSTKQQQLHTTSTRNSIDCFLLELFFQDTPHTHACINGVLNRQCHGTRLARRRPCCSSWLRHCGRGLEKQHSDVLHSVCPRLPPVALYARGLTLVQICDTLVMFCVCARACVCARVSKLHALQLAVTDEKQKKQKPKQNKTWEPQSNRLVRLDGVEQLDVLATKQVQKSVGREKKPPNMNVFFPS